MDWTVFEVLRQDGFNTESNRFSCQKERNNWRGKVDQIVRNFFLVVQVVVIHQVGHLLLRLSLAVHSHVILSFKLL